MTENMNLSENWIETLRERLKQPLPGPEAHVELSTIGRKLRVEKADKTGARRSAVLMLLYQKEDGWHIPLIRRPNYEGVHGGQMALPGGKIEEQDPSLAHTALRETQEEIGIEVKEGNLIGALSELYIPPSHSLVTPYIAFAPSPQEFKPDPNEVDQVFEMAIADFLDPAKRRTRSVTVMGNYQLEVPAYYIQEQTVWGATAMMMTELLYLIKELRL